VVDEAYAACLRIAREHYENFPVASFLVPAPLRPHVAAIYAFARGADDIADEPGRTPDERLDLLEAWQRALHTPPESQVFEALHHTRRQFDLPVELFEDLLSAFRQDVVKTRYATWDELFDYCRRSANPVGRLVLRLAGVARHDADARSDAVCTALQLTNFWQDLEVDWARGRLYVPEEVWAASGADPADLDRKQWTSSWRAALERCATQTERLFHDGRPVCDLLRGRLRYELRATWLGGTRILDKLRAGGFDVFSHRPRLTRADVIVIGLKSLTWRATPRSTTRS
jgi:hydroxysqualene synthase